MKAAGLAAGALLGLAAPALAEPWGLAATPAPCAALEALVIFGLIDAGLGGDTTEYTGIVASGSGQRCLAWLDSLGFGDGIRLDACSDVFEQLNAKGLPRGFGRTDEEVIREILSAQVESDCTDLAFDLRTDETQD
jgi:hypothetical protein